MWCTAKSSSLSVLSSNGPSKSVRCVLEAGHTVFSLRVRSFTTSVMVPPKRKRTFVEFRCELYDRTTTRKCEINSNIQSGHWQSKRCQWNKDFFIFVNLLWLHLRSSKKDEKPSQTKSLKNTHIPETQDVKGRAARRLAKPKVWFIWNPFHCLPRCTGSKCSVRPLKLLTWLWTEASSHTAPVKFSLIHNQPCYNLLMCGSSQ